MLKIIKRLFLVIGLFVLSNCNTLKFDKESETEKINILLNNWHIAAKDAHFESYMNLISEDGFYIGTDASEIWTRKEFKAFSKPYFDKKETWNFKALKRNIHFSKKNNVAWFNENLITWMGECRGSGILENTNGHWKIKQYVLSLIVPNDKMKEAIEVLKEE